MLNHAAPGGWTRPLSWIFAGVLTLSMLPLDISAQAAPPQAPQAAAPAMPSFTPTPDYRALMDEMRRLDASIRAQQATAGQADRATVELFNSVAEHVNRIVSAQEAARVADRAAQGLDWMDEELARLRLQQESLTRQMQQIVEQQRLLNERHMRILNELNRLRSGTNQP